MRDSEDPTQTYRTSYPVTALDDPHQSMPVVIEAAIREELREIFPTLADRPLAKTKICWYVAPRLYCLGHRMKNIDSQGSNKQPPATS